MVLQRSVSPAQPSTSTSLARRYAAYGSLDVRPTRYSGNQFRLASQQAHKSRSSIPGQATPTPKPQPGNPSLGSFNFKDLGATRGVKIVVYACIGVLCVSETAFYAKWAYHYFNPQSKDPGQEEGNE